MEKAKILLLLLFSIVSVNFLSAQKKMYTIQVQTPGSLETEIASLEAKGSIEALKVEGALNGKDIAYLRKLAGGLFDLTIPAESDATLSFLDLKKVTFVKDNERYCSLEDAYPEPGYIGKKMFAACPKLHTIVLPKGITMIKEGAFSACKNLYEVRNTDAVEEFDSGVFKGCSSLQIVSFSESLRVIRGEAFKDCASLSGLVFGASLIDIGSNAFEASGLRSVVLPLTAANLGDCIFKNCKRLQEVWIDAPLKTVPTGLFSGCSALRRVHFPENVNIIASEAFSDCNALQRLELTPHCGSIMEHAFENCKQLKQLVLPALDKVSAKESFSKDLLSQMELYVPNSIAEQYRSEEPWNKMKVFSIEDFAAEDKDLFDDDFDAYPDSPKEWHGSDLWITQEGAYIRTIVGNRVLKLGDNEGIGAVRSKALNLKANAGKFRMKFKADAWNDIHNNFMIDVCNSKGEVTYTQKVIIPTPEMGNSLRQFDIELLGGTEGGYIKIYTTKEGRIVFVDDVHIYSTTQEKPYYVASSEAFDFGRVNVNEEVSDKVCFIYGEHMSKMPKIKVVSKHLGIFSVDVEGDEKMSRATVMLDTEKIGTYEAYLRVEYNETNILYIPIKAIVQDPGNPYNLDDTHPIVELNETFDAKALIPVGWKNIAVEGTRKWMMRTTGGINANRYPAIDALGDTKGKVHALLVLPAIDFDSDVLAQGKSLFFKLATVKESGATLRLVDLTKEGVITPLLDITQSVDGDWKTIQYPIDSLPERGVRFLAFEYIGEEKTKATIYRIDDVKIDKTILSSNQVDPIPFTIAVEGQILYIKGDIERKDIILWSMEGCLITQTQTALSEISIPLPTKGAYVVQIGDKIQKVYVQ